MTNNDRTVSALVVLSSVGACTTITLSQALVEDRKNTFESSYQSDFAPTNSSRVSSSV